MTISEFDYALLALQKYAETPGHCHLTGSLDVVKENPDTGWCCCPPSSQVHVVEDVSLVYAEIIQKSQANLSDYSLPLLINARKGLHRLIANSSDNISELNLAVNKLSIAIASHPKSFKS